MHARIRTLLGAGVLGLVLASTTNAQTSSTGAAGDETPAAFHALVRARYAAAAWPRGALRDGLPIALELEGWSAGALRRMGGTLTRPFTRATRATQGGAEETSFVLETVVADSVDGSHAVLLSWLAGLQSPQVMPTARELGFDVGDVAYVGRSGAGPGALAWIAFARGNVAVRVVAFDPRREPALEQVAGHVDAAILARPALPAGATPSRPRVDVLVAEHSTVAAGGRVRLDLTVTDSAEGEPHVEWIVGGTGQAYVQRAADGFSYLHTTGPGPIALTAAVTSSTGTFAQRTIDLDVTEEP